MKKIIKKVGTSAGLILTKEDMKILNAKIGDIVDLGDIVVVKAKGKKK